MTGNTLFLLRSVEARIGAALMPNLQEGRRGNSREGGREGGRGASSKYESGNGDYVMGSKLCPKKRGMGKDNFIIF